MPNFIFFSSIPGSTIENLKLTVRFKSDNLAESSWIFRIIMKTPNQEDVIDKQLIIYLLIKQALEEEIRIRRIAVDESHSLLRESEYLEYLGRSFKIIDKSPYKLEIDENYDIRCLRQKKLILPEKIEFKLEKILDSDISRKILRKTIISHRKDTGLKICFPEVELRRNELYIFQFELVLENFIPLDVLHSMEDPGSGRALGINLHNRTQDDEIFSKMSTQIPDIKSLELWVCMPHRHLILSSSPKYKDLYWFGPWEKERLEKLQRKYESLERVKEFMETVGDVWVKIVLDNHDMPRGIEDQITITGFSPWVGGRFQEAARELETKARNLVKKNELELKLEKLEDEIERSYVSYKEAFSTWGLFATFFAVLLTIVVLITQNLAGVSIVTEKRGFTLGEMIKFAVLFSLILIAVNYGVRFALKRLGMIKNK